MNDQAAFGPITLAGQYVRLVPLSPDHGAQLAEVARRDDLWRLWYTGVPAPGDMDAEIARRLALQHSGAVLPFAVIDPACGEAVGMTTYMNIDAAAPRVEIGSTWYARRVVAKVITGGGSGGAGTAPPDFLNSSREQQWT